jgi:hypothetical protein
LPFCLALLVLYFVLADGDGGGIAALVLLLILPYCVVLADVGGDRLVCCSLVLADVDGGGIVAPVLLLVLHDCVVLAGVAGGGIAALLLHPFYSDKLHLIAAHGGYARLVSLSLEDAKEFVDKADKAHDRWVGVEPLSTQYAAEQTFTTTRFNKELSGAYKHHYALGNPYLARLRVPPKQVGKRRQRTLLPREEY